MSEIGRRCVWTPTPTPVPVIAWSDLAPVATALTDAIPVANVIGILAGIFGVSAVFVLLWFGIKKLIRVFFGAVNSGRMSSGAGGRRGR